LSSLAVLVVRILPDYSQKAHVSPSYYVALFRFDSGLIGFKYFVFLTHAVSSPYFCGAIVGQENTGCSDLSIRINVRFFPFLKRARHSATHCGWMAACGQMDDIVSGNDVLKVSLAGGLELA
jgi:hypothetical protein